MDAIEFTEKFLHNPDGSKMTLHKTQQEVVKNVKKLTTIVTGRQWGKSTLMEAYICWFAVTHKARQVYIIAPSLSQARIIFNGVMLQFTHAPLKSMLAKEPSEYPFPHITLVNGTEIHARGSTSEKYIRGNRAHLIVCDEAAYFKEGVIPSVVEPMQTVVGKEPDSAMLLISTPLGEGDFKAYYEDSSSASFTYNSYDNPHADRSFLDKIKNRYGEDSLVWQTEYLGRFLDDANQVFSSSVIKRAMENFPYDKLPQSPIDGHRYSQGVDLANRHDWFVSTVLDYTDLNSIPLVRMERYQRRGYSYYKDRVRTIARDYHSRNTIDATTLGEAFVEDVKDINPTGFVYTSQSKYDLIQNFSNMLQEGRILLPNDPEIFKELLYFQYIVTPSKNVRMEAKRGYHDDIVNSLALSSLGIPRFHSRSYFIPVNSKIGFPQDDTDYRNILA